MELPQKRLKIMLAIALGVIIILILFMFKTKVIDHAQARTKLDSLEKTHVNIKLSLALSKKNVALLQKRDRQWQDSLRAERTRNKTFVTRILFPPATVQLNQNEVDSVLSKRYNAKVHVTPVETGSQIVAELDILDQSIAYIPRVETEVEHWQKAFATKDSLNQALIKQDSLRIVETANVSEETKTLKTDNDALTKENKKLTRGNRFWKGVCKVMAGALVAVGFIAATK